MCGQVFYISLSEKVRFWTAVLDDPEHSPSTDKTTINTFNFLTVFNSYAMWPNYEFYVKLGFFWPIVSVNQLIDKSSYNWNFATGEKKEIYCNYQVKRFLREKNAVSNSHPKTDKREIE